MLEHEEDNRREILLAFGPHFRKCDQIVALGSELLSALCAERKAEFNPKLKSLLLALLARGLRQCRSAILLCEYGDSENAGILTRSLYEGLLAVRFVLMPWKRPKKSKRLPKIPRGADRRLFRADLYCAHPVIKQCVDMEKVLKLRGARKVIEKSHRKSMRESAQEAKDEIGTAWAAILEKSSHYSGLQIAQLAQAVGLREWHLKVYPVLSSKAHGGNALNFFGVSGTTTHISTVGEAVGIPTHLELVSSIFGTLMEDINKEFGGGFETRLAAIARLLEKPRPATQT